MECLISGYSCVFLIAAACKKCRSTEDSGKGVVERELQLLVNPRRVCIFPSFFVLRKTLDAVQGHDGKSRFSDFHPKRVEVNN